MQLLGGTHGIASMHAHNPQHDYKLLMDCLHTFMCHWDGYLLKNKMNFIQLRWYLLTFMFIKYYVI